MKKCTRCKKELEDETFWGIAIYIDDNSHDTYEVHEEENGFCSMECAIHWAQKMWLMED